jgi:Protein of unknown function DUF262
MVDDGEMNGSADETTGAVQDVEESEQILDAPDEDPVGFWEQKQRDLVTSVLDYNLGTLSDLIQSKTIDLSPTYQRRFRWDNKRQSKLIESFLMNVPVPSIFLNEDEYGQYSVIDGKQRLNAIHRFMRGRLKLEGLKIFSDINGKTVDDLPESLQNVIKTRANLRAIIILRQSDQDIKFEVFQRLNTGGVRLNPQEIRNSTWPGPLNDLILELSQDSLFHQLLGITDRNRSVIYKEMRDAEFVLRYFTFRDSWSTFSGGMMRAMDRFMAANHRMGREDLAHARDDFMASLKAVDAVFGEHAFRRWVPEGNYWRQQALAALFDAEMLGIRGLPSEQLAPHRDSILTSLQGLFSDEDFRKSIDAATNTPGLFKYRISTIRRLLESVVEPN